MEKLSQFNIEKILTTKTLLATAFVAHIVLCYFSVGFYHPDEQYYAIDIALKKLNLINTPPSWEEIDQIRSHVLPWLFAGIIYILSIFKISNPFTVAFLLRVISSVLAFAATNLFCTLFRNNFSNLRTWLTYLGMMNFAFFIPFIHARTSSDNWGTSFLLLGIFFYFHVFNDSKLNNILLNKNFKIIIGSIFFAIAFLLRFQTAIISGIVIVYALIIFKHFKLKQLIGLYLLPALTILAIGIAIDSISYKGLTITFWNYFLSNIYQNKISQFGVSPFYYYINLIIIKLTPAWGIAFIVSLISSAKNDFKNYSWMKISVFAFFLFHSLIGHKELRFLFPLAPLMITILSLELSRKKILHFKHWFFIILTIINAMALLVVTFTPAYKPLKFYKFMYEYFQVPTVVFIENNTKLELEYYKNKNVQVIPFEQEAKPISVAQKADNLQQDTYVFFNSYTNQVYFYKNNNSCSVLFSTYPNILLRHLPERIKNRLNIWTLFKCPSQKKQNFKLQNM